MSTNAESGLNLSRSDIIKWLIALGLCAILAFLPTSEVLTFQLKWFFVITVVVKLFCNSCG